MVETCYRQVLRLETHAHHARVDAALSADDIGLRYGFVRFLGIHAVCFQAMAKVAEGGSVAHRTLLQMSENIRVDLDRLDAGHGDIAAPVADHIDPLALDYMIEGSRLGTKILKRKWAASTDATVRSADAYLSLHSDPRSWRDVCGQLSAVPVDSPRAATITSDTKRLFDLFSSVAAQWDATKQLTEEALQ